MPKLLERDGCRAFLESRLLLVENLCACPVGAVCASVSAEWARLVQARVCKSFYSGCYRSFVPEIFTASKGCRAVVRLHTICGPWGEAYILPTVGVACRPYPCQVNRTIAGFPMLVSAAVVGLERRQLEIGEDRFVLNLRDKRGSTLGVFTKFLFRLNEFPLDFIQPLIDLASRRGGGARCDPSDAQVSTPSWFECSRRVRASFSLLSGGGFIHARWMVDRTLGLTFDDTSDMVDSYYRLSSMRSERSIVVRPDGVAQRRSAPSLMNAFQHGFGFRGGQVITFSPRSGLCQLNRLLDLSAVVDY
ncbi:hypothetical protein B296_00022425 [Ensete ventricosum]|uniref:Uncharacterized protein n=1 Tax=Ensete ventricosum TaxID=4639 RepID=A0A427AVY0_ENSVE|nr:hypothetical protein B296_00022425 [Ensete ventricosum]